MRFLFNSVVVLVFLLFGLFHKVCLVKWSNFHDGCYTSTGSLDKMSDISLSRCTTECFVNTECEVFGYGSFGKNCYLYDGTFSTSTTQSCSRGSSSSISFYRVTCGQLSDYTYVTSLKKCISYKSDERVVWEDARDVCINDGGHLVYVTTQGILDYIDGHRESLCLVKWSKFHDGCYTGTGRFNKMSDISLSRCTAECFVNTKCEVFGYGSWDKNCFLYDGAFSTSGTQSCSVGSSNSISYYRVGQGNTCDQQSDYTYVTSLKKCISYKSDRLDWDDARDVCINDGGHLAYVTTQGILDYIDGHREGSNTKYWVGGAQSENGSNIYEWLSGETIDSTNGGQLWFEGRPDLDGRTSKICIETKYSSTKNFYGLFDRDCSSIRKFFCEIDIL